MTPIEILNSNSSVLALIGVIATVITNYVIQKKQTKVDSYTVDMNSLSNDQKEFRNSILEELNTCRENVESLKEENEMLRQKSLTDDIDKHNLLIKIAHLEEKIIKLKEQIDDIMKRVKNSDE